MPRRLFFVFTIAKINTKNDSPFSFADIEARLRIADAQLLEKALKDARVALLLEFPPEILLQRHEFFR